MKYWQYFFVISAIYVAPHTSEMTGIIIAIVCVIAGFIAQYLDD